MHSEHQIRFAGRHHPPPPAAAEQRAGHPQPRERSVLTGPRLSRPGRPVHLAPPGAAHPASLHPQPQLPRGHGLAADSWPPAQPQPPSAGAAGPPPLPDSRGGALTPRYAALRQPAGPQPHHAGQLLQPGQPGLAPRGLGQRTGEAQLRLKAGWNPPGDTTPPCAPSGSADSHRICRHCRLTEGSCPQPMCCQTRLLELGDELVVHDPSVQVLLCLLLKATARSCEEEEESGFQSGINVCKPFQAKMFRQTAEFEAMDELSSVF